MKQHSSAKKIIKRTFQYILIAITALFIVYPLLFTLLTSFKTKEGYLVNPFGIDFENITFANYSKILTNFDFLSKLANTAFVVGTSVLIILILAIPSAYYMNTIKNKAIKTTLIIVFFALMFIPEEVIVLPEYNLMTKIGLINNYWSVIIIFVTSSLPEAIFLLSMYFEAIPSDIINAAKLDGADDFYCLTYFVIPIAKSPIIVVTVTTTISLWNAFLVPMLMLYEEEKKLLIPSLSGLITKHSSSPTYQMAGMILSMIPLVITYIVFKKQIFENNIGGSIK